PVTISVNQSRLHMTEEDYLEKMRALVKKYKLPKGLIELELTETVFGDFDQKAQREQAASTIHALKEMGFIISVDDFGSGYSSYTLLNYLPMDVMKIDRSLLIASDDSDRMRSILGNIIQLGRLLDMKVLCEGIETPEQELLLLELGCEYGQGYLNAKPMPEADYLAFLEAHC
ncbi:MAG: EAL domain-containing protein, partial [Selenomonadaceae bacterium]|nr:EAL domain-containing protein [Selenomonadaceae bacterium]